MDSPIAKLYQSPKTILTTKDLALIWQETNPANLNAKVAYYVKRGALRRLTRGVFAKSDHYHSKELATSIYLPSYISFETVLREAGIIFQYYETIFVASKWPKTLQVDQHTITFRKIKDSVLFNSVGIVHQDHFSQATAERALLDMLYLFPNYYFDNLRPINWAKCNTIVPIYNNHQLVKRLQRYRHQYAQ